MWLLLDAVSNLDFYSCVCAYEDKLEEALFLTSATSFQNTYIKMVRESTWIWMFSLFLLGNSTNGRSHKCKCSVKDFFEFAIITLFFIREVRRNRV